MKSGTDSSLVKPLPHSTQAEQAVLGSIFIRNEVLPVVEHTLEPDDFYREHHQRIFEAVRRVSRRGEAVDPVTVTEELKRSGQLEKIHGGAVYVASLLDGVSKSANVEHYAREVRSAAARREIIGRATKLIDAAFDGADDSDLGRHVTDLAEAFGGMDWQPLLSEDLAEILARPAPPTPWAVKRLLAEGDIVLISGPGGIGKSWLALAEALALAAGRDLFDSDRFNVTRPYRVAVLDLESRPFEIDQRLHRLARGMGLAPQDLRGRVQVVRQRVRLDQPGELRRFMASLKAWRTEFVFVDSLRRAFAGNENDSAVISDLFVGALDPLRTELGCGVILTDHIRKPTGERDLDAAEVALRGSTDKRNLADAHFGIEPRGDRLAFIPTKTRHARLPESILLELSGLGEDAAHDGPVAVRSVGNLDRASDKVQDVVLALLGEVGAEGLVRSEVIGKVAGGTGYSTRAVESALAALRSRRLLSVKREGRQARYSLLSDERPQPPQTSAEPFEGA